MALATKARKQESTCEFQYLWRSCGKLMSMGYWFPRNLGPGKPPEILGNHAENKQFSQVSWGFPAGLSPQNSQMSWKILQKTHHFSLKIWNKLLLWAPGDLWTPQTLQWSPSGLYWGSDGPDESLTGSPPLKHPWPQLLTNNCATTTPISLTADSAPSSANCTYQSALGEYLLFKLA